MSDYERPADLLTQLADLKRRLDAIELAVGVRRYDTTTRPAPAAVKGAIIFNTSTGTHQLSNGSVWTEVAAIGAHDHPHEHSKLVPTYDDFPDKSVGFFFHNVYGAFYASDGATWRIV